MFFIFTCFISLFHNFYRFLSDKELPLIEDCPEDKPGNIITNFQTNTNYVELVVPKMPTFSDNSLEPLNKSRNIYVEEGKGYKFPIGMTNIVYTATDASGNQATCQYSVEVILGMLSDHEVLLFIKGPVKGDPIGLSENLN